MILDLDHKPAGDLVRYNGELISYIRELRKENTTLRRHNDELMRRNCELCAGRRSRLDRPRKPILGPRWERGE